jgi:putative ABC transport system permease protein
MRALIELIALLFRRWTWLMAWRDSRRSRGKLLLYASSIILGVAALTAISSFGDQMRRAIDEQAKSLLGADLAVTSRDPLNAAQNDFLGALGGEQSREIAFGTMVVFPTRDGTRLVQVRALEGGFPFYGDIEATPASAEAEFRSGKGALVEQSLMDFYQVNPGDPVKIGEVTLPIVGTLTAVPGETVAFGAIAPRIYVPMTAMTDSGLLGQGSLVNYKAYLKLPESLDVQELVEEREQEFRDLGLRFDTVAERQRELGRGLDLMLRFLNLAGFIALLLGGVGVASGVHVHMKQKLGAVATLRCLGTTVPQAFAIYLAQALTIGLIGATAGALCGGAAQYLLMLGIADFLPVKLAATVSPGAIWHGIWIGFFIAMVFALLPLLPIRRVPPLAALRSAFSHEMAAARDPLVWLVYAIAATGLVAFGIAQSRNWQTGVGYAVGIAGAFLMLAVFGWLLSHLTRRLFSAHWPFVWRQGVTNLHRPGNRTVLLMQSLGMGVFLIMTMYLVQRGLLTELIPVRSGKEGNAVLFDIQPDQRDGVQSIIRELDLLLLEDAPMISMRLQTVKGESVEELKKVRTRFRGSLTREYRSTFRSHLAPTEKLVAGEWHAHVESLDEPVPISLEVELAGRLEVELGDELVFDVQGVAVACRVASLREVDWRRLSPNFFVVFPAGAIEAAPAVHAMVTRVENPEVSANLQRRVVQQFPNVSAIDLTLVLRTIDGIVEKIAGVVRFMATFTVGTGLLVLTGAIASGRQQRLRESILLRTLGATRAQVRGILATEYAVLGLLAALNGVLLAHLGAWAVSRWVFEVPFQPQLWPAAVALVTASVITLTAGLLGNRNLLDRPPLEMLRSET